MNTKAIVIAILCTGIAITVYFLVSSIFPPELEKNDFKCGSGFVPGMQLPHKPLAVNMTDLSNPHHSVIVIGAGVSGLEAAKQLKSKGMDVIILEARDRIGGRVFTNNSMGMSLDLGGSWIHGLNKGSGGFENPIYKIVQNNDIKLVETPQTVTLYNSSHLELDDNSYDLHDKFAKFAQKYDESLSEDARRTLSVQDVIDRYYNSMNLTDRSEIANYRYTMYWYNDMDQADNTANIAFENSLETQYFNGDEDNEGIFPNGYNQIVNCLAGESIIKHATVTKVDYTHHPIVVTAYNGTSYNEVTFKADYVVSTLPLGVLKNHSVEFNPPLENDPNKVDAIEHLKMGTMDKVYLVFNYTQTQSPFWITGSTWINRTPDVNDTVKATDKKWQFFFNLYNYDSQPILIAFNTGSSAKELENESDTEIKNEVMAKLRSMYGNDIPEPTKIVRTKWANDPFSFGSYSYIPTHGSLDDFDKLAMPINDTLFFAGEATNRYYYGTVHAAYISGYQAAEEILQLQNNIDPLEQQLEHGVKKWDVICPSGQISNVEVSTDKVICILKK